ncbi:hypothetical protein ACGTN9_17165 [Halobacillus sp. MO56]
MQEAKLRTNNINQSSPQYGPKKGGRKHAKSRFISHCLLLPGENRRLIQAHEDGKKIVGDLLLAFKKETKENDDNPLEILKLRYVKGEISKHDYEQIAKNL